MALKLRKAAVLGAGVMGAQIAAHMANAGVPVLLFDLPAKEGDPNAIPKRAIEHLRKLAPPPLVSPGAALRLEPANYDSDLHRLAECDLVIESIAERMDWKVDLYRKVAGHVRPDAAIASNTSGLSIEEMARAIPEALRARFCGVHFFNPPRYMRLVELIPLAATDPDLLDDLEGFLGSTLGKGVIRGFDTPNFVANRIGTFSILSTLSHTREFGLGLDEVDALTGPVIGRAASATYRTIDVVGLDTLAHVLKTMDDRLPDDPWHRHFKPRGTLTELIEKGALGQKSGGGFFRKEGAVIKVLDPATGAYVPASARVDDQVAAILALRDPAERFRALRGSSNTQARFLWAVFRDLFHYSAYHLAEIANNARDFDFALRWGFGWKQGPFETWQSAGWSEIAKAIDEDRAAGRAMADAPLPEWVFTRDGVHAPSGSYSPRADALEPRRRGGALLRQRFPERVFGEDTPESRTILETDCVRLWVTTEPGSDDVAILSFKTKAATVGAGVLDGISDAVERAEKDCKGLVIWQPAPPFSAGADLRRLLSLTDAGDIAGIEAMVTTFQQATARLRYALVPTVSAISGFALGGGCEIAMHSTLAVAALESRIGLVEAAVGLVPAGGGMKEFAIRAARLAERGNIDDPLEFLYGPFRALTSGKPSASAVDAAHTGYLRPSDLILFNPHEILSAAQALARARYEASYRPPPPPSGIKVAGRGGIATLRQSLLNARDGDSISEHDYRVGSAIATGLCGGDVETGTLVDEDWLLGVERRLFVELSMTPETQARIRGMLDTGKPPRN